MVRLGRLGLVAALLFQACGSGSSAEPEDQASGQDQVSQDVAGQDDSPAPPMTYAEFIAGYHTADCDREQRCDKPPAQDSVEACLAAIDPAVTLQNQRVGQSVADGKVSFDSNQAAECIQIIGSGCSTNYITILGVCNDVTRGKLPVGSACIAHYECDPMDDTSANGPWCFEGCGALFGAEEPAGNGTCVDVSPVGSAECQ